MGQCGCKCLLLTLSPNQSTEVTAGLRDFDQLEDEESDETFNDQMEDNFGSFIRDESKKPRIQPTQPLDDDSPKYEGSSSRKVVDRRWSWSFERSGQSSSLMSRSSGPSGSKTRASIIQANDRDTNVPHSEFKSSEIKVEDSSVPYLDNESVPQLGISTVAVDAGAGLDSHNLKFHLIEDTKEISSTTTEASRTLQSTPDSGGAANGSENTDVHFDEALLFTRLMTSENGEIKKARKRFEDTIEWRQKEGVGNVFREGAPYFHVIKSFFPHCIHGRDREGRPVIYQRPGSMNLTALNAHGLELNCFVKHYIFVEEYLAKHVHKTEDDAVIKVIDLAGLKSSDLTPELRNLLRVSVKLGSHYPGRTHRLILINKPIWASVLLVFISGLLSTNEQKKLLSFSQKSSLQGLKEFIEENQIPKELGGRSEFQMGNAPEEIRLYNQVRRYEEMTHIDVRHILPSYKKSTTGWIPKPPNGFENQYP